MTVSGRNFAMYPGRGTRCELVVHREVNDCALVDLVVIVWQHKPLPEGARHIDLLTEVVNQLL